MNGFPLLPINKKKKEETEKELTVGLVLREEGINHFNQRTNMQIGVCMLFPWEPLRCGSSGVKVEWDCGRYQVQI